MVGCMVVIQSLDQRIMLDISQEHFHDYRKPLYFMVKTMVSCRFSQQNQSIEYQYHDYHLVN